MKGSIPPLPSTKRGTLSGLNPNITSNSVTHEYETRKENYVPSVTATENKSTQDQNRNVNIPPLKRHNTKISGSNNASSPLVPSSVLDVSKRSRLKDSSPKQIPPLGTNTTLSPSTTTLNLSPALNSYQEARVLRFGETMESFFCLPSNLTCQFSFRHEGKDVLVDWSRHYELCKDIIHDSNGAANDIEKWRQVVEVAFHYVQRQSTEQNPLGDDLIRLLRRATNRFLSIGNLSTTHISCPLLELWLLYCNATTLYSSREEARLIFFQMQRRLLGIKSASFYIAYADFELQACNCDAQSKASNEDCPCMTKARTIVDLGLQNLAEPLDKLRSYSRNLGRIRLDNQVSFSLKDPINAVVTSETPLPQYNYKQPSLSKPSHNLSDEGSVKEKTCPSSLSTLPTILETFSVDDDTIHPIALYQPEIKTKTKSSYDEFKSIPKCNMDNTSLNSKTHQESTGTSSSSKLQMSINGLSDKRSRIESDKEYSTSTRLRSLSSRPQLGRPQRVQSSKDPDTKENEADNDSAGNLLENIGTSKPLTRADIGYMLNWKPTGPRPSSAPTQSASNEDPNCNRGNGIRLETIDEITSPSVAKISSNAFVNKISREEQGRIVQPPATKRDLPEDPVVTDMHASQQKITVAALISTPETSEKKSSASPSLRGKANPLFLPLACEENILHVNGQPYMKLSVIGSGASCKVYRALSKDKTIVAIKKVKKEEMSQKALEGYANEIALLRKLQGCPSIIQMFDSQVDASRKLIYVVMELGEIDLNHVLKKQHQIQTDNFDGIPANQSSLNMNFIRLTWQQMLSAVDSIHQERIIHGDLKPANFLFVKGALKLIDFGIAKAIQSDDTTNIYHDHYSGTLSYSSPECFLGTGTGANGGTTTKCGKPSDIWSLGCILYEMCYGKTPFADMDMRQKIISIINPSYKISFPNTTDEAAIDAMKQCLRREPEQRATIRGENGLLTAHRFINT